MELQAYRPTPVPRNDLTKGNGGLVGPIECRLSQEPAFATARNGNVPSLNGPWGARDVFHRDAGREAGNDFVPDGSDGRGELVG